MRAALISSVEQVSFEIAISIANYNRSRVQHPNDTMFKSVAFIACVVLNTGSSFPKTVGFIKNTGCMLTLLTSIVNCSFRRLRWVTQSLIDAISHPNSQSVSACTQRVSGPNSNRSSSSPIWDLRPWRIFGSI